MNYFFKLKYATLLFLLFLLCGSFVGLIFSGCSKRFTNNPLANQPPNTFVSIFSSGNLNPVISQQTLHWWGDDPDGIVAGYIHTFNPNATNHTRWSDDQADPDWTFTEKTENTFILTLAGLDTIYSFWVKAVDNEGLTDPEGAIQQFNIVNTPPRVEFPVGTEVPDTTFTVASFVWSGSDPDGDNTIQKYQYALDDTVDQSAWIDLGAKQTSITLFAADGLTEGDHAFYLRVIDLAGASSSIMKMPREGDTWFVKEPKSNFLIIDDYNVGDNADSFYFSAVQKASGETPDTWDIKANANALEPASPQAFRETMKLFKRILWYADSNPNLEKANVSVRQFLEGGGELLMTSSFQAFASNLGDPLNFSPADSLGEKISRITRDQLVVPSAEFAGQGFPELQVAASIIPNVYPIEPKISSTVIYQLPETDSGKWSGSPAICVVNADRNFVFFGLPIASLDGQGTAMQVVELFLTGILAE